MNRWGAVVALTTIAVTAQASDPFDAYFSDISILQLKPVQVDLGITQAQRTEMNKHATWLNSKGGPIDAQVRAGKLKPEEGNKQMAAHIASLKAKVLGVLSAAQVKRLREITLQRDGLLPLLDSRIADKIGLTKAQRTKLAGAYAANDKQAKEIQKRSFSPIFAKYEKLKPKDAAEKDAFNAQANKELDAEKKKILPQLEALGKSYAQLVETTLSKGQRDAFAALKGRPFVPNGPKK